VSEADLSFRIAGPTGKPGRPAHAAIAAALALHLIVLYLLLFGFHEDKAPEPKPIQVTLVALPPPVPPAPAQPPRPQQKRLSERESGPGQQTTAAPHAATPSPQTETPAPQPQPSEAANPEDEAPVPKGLEPPPPAEKPKRPDTPPVETQKPKLALRAPDTHPPLDRMLGDTDETGDPYLNSLWSRIERNRAQTTPVGPAGLHLEGITVFELLIDHDGRMERIQMLTSSGSPLLDQEARRMIVAATPFPAAPDDYPDRIPLKITIHLFPQ